MVKTTLPLDARGKVDVSKLQVISRIKPRRKRTPEEEAFARRLKQQIEFRQKFVARLKPELRAKLNLMKKPDLELPKPVTTAQKNIFREIRKQVKDPRLVIQRGKDFKKQISKPLQPGFLKTETFRGLQRLQRAKFKNLAKGLQKITKAGVEYTDVGKNIIFKTFGLKPDKRFFQRNVWEIFSKPIKKKVGLIGRTTAKDGSQKYSFNVDKNKIVVDVPSNLFATVGNVSRPLTQSEKTQYAFQEATKKAADIGVLAKSGRLGLEVGKWVARLPFEIGTIPSLAVQGASQVASGYLLFDKEAKKRTQNFLRATPGALLKAFDPRKLGGLLNLTTLAVSVGVSAKSIGRARNIGKKLDGLKNYKGNVKYSLKKNFVEEITEASAVGKNGVLLKIQRVSKIPLKQWQSGKFNFKGKVNFKLTQNGKILTSKTVTENFKAVSKQTNQAIKEALGKGSTFTGSQITAGTIKIGGKKFKFSSTVVGDKARNVLIAKGGKPKIIKADISAQKELLAGLDRVIAQRLVKQARQAKVPLSKFLKSKKAQTILGGGARPGQIIDDLVGRTPGYGAKSGQRIFDDILKNARTKIRAGKLKTISQKRSTLQSLQKGVQKIGNVNKLTTLKINPQRVGALMLGKTSLLTQQLLVLPPVLSNDVVSQGNLKVIASALPGAGVEPITEPKAIPESITKVGTDPGVEVVPRTAADTITTATSITTTNPIFQSFFVPSLALPALLPSIIPIPPLFSGGAYRGGPISSLPRNVVAIAKQFRYSPDVAARLKGIRAKNRNQVERLLRVGRVFSGLEKRPLV